jgi:hypothetical protein
MQHPHGRAIQLMCVSGATHLCLFHSDVHIPIQASKDPYTGKAMELSELILTQMHAYCSTSIVDTGI